MANPPQAAHSITYFLLHGLQLLEAKKSPPKKKRKEIYFDDEFEPYTARQCRGGINRKKGKNFKPPMFLLIHSHIESEKRITLRYTARYRGS